MTSNEHHERTAHFGGHKERIKACNKAIHAGTLVPNGIWGVRIYQAQSVPVSDKIRRRLQL